MGRRRPPHIQYLLLTLLGKGRYCVEDVDGIDQAVVADAPLHANRCVSSKYRALFELQPDVKGAPLRKSMPTTQKQAGSTLS